MEEDPSRPWTGMSSPVPQPYLVSMTFSGKGLVFKTIVCFSLGEGHLGLLGQGHLFTGDS